MVAQALGKTPGQVLDDLIALDKKGVHPLN